MADITAMHNVLRKIIIIVHDAGRFAMLSDVLKDPTLDQPDFDVMRKWCEIASMPDKEALLLSFLRKFPQIFYVWSTQDKIIIALSRRFAYFYPRIASALMKVSDPNRESIIQCPSRIPKYPPLHLQNNGRYFEYEFAKASLAVLEIMDIISSCFKKKRGRKLTKKVVEVLASKLGPLGTVTLAHCSPDHDSLEKGFLSFASLFPKIFDISGPTMSVDYGYLECACLATENDLYRSFVGICLTRGITKFSELLREVTDFVRRAGLRHSGMWNAGTLDTFVRTQRNMCLYPGDGNVYLMNPCLRIPEVQLELIEEFFLVHVSRCGRKGLHYKDCYKVLKRDKPRLLEGHEDETAITIASHLYSMANVFELDHGHFKLSDQWYGPQYEILQVEAPTDVFRIERPGSGLSLYDGLGVGYVKDVGIRSAVIKLEGPLTHAKGLVLDCSSPETFAFCHMDFTLFNGEPIEDFTKIFDFEDFAKFMFDINETVDIKRPFYVDVVNLIHVGLSDYASSGSCRSRVNSSSSSGGSGPGTPVKCPVPFKSARRETEATIAEGNVVRSEKNDESTDGKTAKTLGGALIRRAALRYDLGRHCPQCRKAWMSNAVLPGVYKTDSLASKCRPAARRVRSRQVSQTEPDMQEVVRPNVEERVPCLGNGHGWMKVPEPELLKDVSISSVSINVEYSIRGEKRTVSKSSISTLTLSSSAEGRGETVKLPTTSKGQGKDHQGGKSAAAYSASASAGNREHVRPCLPDRPNASKSSKATVGQPASGRHNASAITSGNLTRRGSHLLLRILGWMKVLSDLGITDLSEIKRNGTKYRSVVVEEIEDARRWLHFVNPTEDMVRMLTECPEVAAVVVPRPESGSDSDAEDESLGNE